MLLLFFPQVSAQFSDPTLISAFSGPIPTCNDVASSWIRAAYHDSGTFLLSDKSPVGADGSLQFELDRPENRGLASTVEFFKGLSTNFKISLADAIAFGGKLAVEVCLPGHTVPFKSGRIDTKSANPPNRLPNIHMSAQAILDDFKTGKGMTVSQLVALIGGAHSVAHVRKEDVTDPAAIPGPLDSTPTILDGVFFQELLAADHKNKLPSDLALTKNPEMLEAVKKFATDAKSLTSEFIAAFDMTLNMGAKFSDTPTPPSSVTTSTSTAAATSTPSNVPIITLPNVTITYSANAICTSVFVSYACGNMNVNRYFQGCVDTCVANGNRNPQSTIQDFIKTASNSFQTFVADCKVHYTTAPINEQQNITDSCPINNDLCMKSRCISNGGQCVSGECKCPSDRYGGVCERTVETCVHAIAAHESDSISTPVPVYGNASSTSVSDATMNHAGAVLGFISLIVSWL